MKPVITLVVFLLVIQLGFLAMLAHMYRKIPSGKTAVRTGVGGMRAISGTGLFVIPTLHQLCLVHAEAEAFEATLGGVPQTVVLQLNCEDEDTKLAAVAFGNKDREETRHVLQTLIATSIDTEDLDARIAQVGYRRL